MAVLLNSCSHAYPVWNGEIFSIDPGDGSVNHASTQEKVNCHDTDARKFRCVTDKDFRSFWATYVIGCSQWRPEVPMGPGNRELNELYQSISDLFDTK